jgi:Fur family zinc uptake transcriptional regulator
MPHEPLIEAWLAQAEARCQAQGAALTALRRDVLRIILAAPAPLTAYQLLDQLKASRKSAVPPTIYRALDFLIAQRLVHRLERLNAFIPCVEAHHHDHDVQFLICGKCGTVAEIEDQAAALALAAAARRHGFRLGHAMVELDGVCLACSQEESSFLNQTGGPIQTAR